MRLKYSTVNITVQHNLFQGSTTQSVFDIIIISLSENNHHRRLCSHPPPFPLSHIHLRLKLSSN